MSVIVKVQCMTLLATAPRYWSAAASGMDLHADVDDGGELVVPAHGFVLVRTGIAVELPPGFEGQVRPRSGLSLAGLIIPNAPGTIDQDYRGEVRVPLRDIAGREHVIRCGDRIAQLVVARVERAEVVQVRSLADSERGLGGFGSTGGFDGR